MTLSDFITKYKGAYWDFDQAFGAQCFDLFQFYNRDVVGGSFVSGNGAVDIWNTYPQALYEKVGNTPDNFPKAGDVVVWGTDYGKYGHVAICTEGDKDKFSCLSQNDPAGQPAIIKTYTSWTGVLGWLRPKQTDTALQACLTQHTALVDELEALKKTSSEALNKDKETISSLNITLTTKNQEIKNRIEQVERITQTMNDGFDARDKKIEALTKLITDSASGIASYQDQIKTLQSQFDNEAKAKGEALILLATSEEKVKQLVKQISENTIDYKALTLKERIKICVDIIFA